MSAVRPGLGIYVDFRNPRQWRQPDARMYQENLELIRIAETLGFTSVWLSEHHFSDDGYAPSPLVIASAVAQATSSIRIGTAVAILPLYHPVRFAEDCAVLDILSEGRLEVGVGIGWRPQEFSAFGVPIAERAHKTDAALAMLRSLWMGDSFDATLDDGTVEQLRLAPLPIQQPTPRLWVGGASRAALRRAARLGDGIVVSGFDAEMRDGYRAELRAAGRDPDSGRIASNLRWFMVADDPERTFAAVAPFVLNWHNHYARWMAGGLGPIVPVADAAELRRLGLLTVLAPDEAAAAIEAHLSIAPLDHLNLKARPPGMPLDDALEHLELLARHVLPLLRGRDQPSSVPTSREGAGCGST